MPVYNDWQAVSKLLIQIQFELAKFSCNAHIYCVDDLSVESPDPEMNSELAKCPNILSCTILPLNRNVGHQKAIALGIAYLQQQQAMSYPTVIMDSDGEDSPSDIQHLLAASVRTPNRIIFAKRQKRSESFVFKLFYAIYKFLFFLFTGKYISFGNFSLIPGSLMSKVAYRSEIWNHYSSGILRSKLPVEFVPTVRATRLAGQSKMNFPSLVLHGMSAISVFIDLVAVRVLLASISTFVISLSLLIYVFLKKYLWFDAIPGWATTAVGTLFSIAIQTIIISLFMLFIVLSYRTQIQFTPALGFQDYFQQPYVFFSHPTLGERGVTG